MASREQNQIIADQWDATSGGRGVMGRVMTYLTTVAGKPAVPGTRAPGVYAPIDVPLGDPVMSPRLHAPLPDFNWADREPRWRYISEDLAPSYTRMVEENPDKAAALLRIPFIDQMAGGRLVPRLPDLLHDLTSTWEVVPAPGNGVITPSRSRSADRVDLPSFDDHELTPTLAGDEHQTQQQHHRAGHAPEQQP